MMNPRLSWGVCIGDCATVWIVTEAPGRSPGSQYLWLAHSFTTQLSSANAEPVSPSIRLRQHLSMSFRFVV